MSQNGHVHKESHSQATPDKIELPFRVIKDFFGHQKLPPGEDNLQKLNNAFLQLDMHKLSDKQLLYLSHLIEQLIIFRKAIYLITAVWEKKKIAENW